MSFNLDKATEILERTPDVLTSLLEGLSDEWIYTNEGEETWSPFDIIGHLIHGEKTDWMIRAEITLSDGPEKTFTPFDRFAQFEESKGKTLSQLLTEFRDLRKKNLITLQSKNITDEDLDKTGIHPAFGDTTLRQLLSTWVAHDLGHIAQISRVMAKQYKYDVGPWRNYLPILDR
ncbi:DinB family protein [Chryseobacterium sp. PTM-20240506]|uniref:DinB family protein n=1 Tax=unclassified Chryseobacterium TaxID=2593645 RepID=UPI0023593C26|nr:DinB family protein [Chryseobacterium sp. B21-037]MDC8105422.1 DinB family protein [Chryseobacterium sp. B21-037]